jgi:hypothetical protein
MIIIDNYFDSGGMHNQGFAGGAGLAHEHTTALVQGAIYGFDDAGLAFTLGTGPVLPAGQHLGVDFPLVGSLFPPAAPCCADLPPPRLHLLPVPRRQIRTVLLPSDLSSYSFHQATLTQTASWLGVNTGGNNFFMR